MKIIIAYHIKNFPLVEHVLQLLYSHLLNANHLSVLGYVLVLQIEYACII